MRAIDIDGLTKHFGPVVGIDGVSLAVERGEVFGFLGANGAGKTTTIRLLMDLLRPTAGTARVLGLDCQRDGRRVRAQVGYLPGDTPIYPDLSAADYLRFLERLGGRPVAAATLQRLCAHLQISDVDLRRRLRDQSHGMKRKIGIVQALMTEPAVAILDEPTSGLDPIISAGFRTAVEELRRRGTTVFLSSHILAEVQALCDRVALIRRGRIASVRTLAEIRASAPRRVTVDFTRAVDAQPALDGIRVTMQEPQRWVLEVRGELGPLLAVLAATPVRDLRVEEFSLEEFLRAEYD